MMNEKPPKIPKLPMSQESLNEAASTLIDTILNTGINGLGPFDGAEKIAADALKHSRGDREKAVAAVIRSHSRMVSASGFVSGLGGFTTMALTLPADITVFYTQSARMVASIAILRGYDPASLDVRSAIAISLVGALGTEAINKIGVEVANKAGAAALQKLPGKVLIKINQKVGFRLVTRAGTTGTINLVKVIPVAASAVGATMNVAGMRSIAGYARTNFPYLAEADPETQPHSPK